MPLFFSASEKNQKRQAENPGEEAFSKGRYAAETKKKASSARTRVPGGRGFPGAAPAGIAEELGEAGRAALVEIFDSSGRPLLCMTPESALRQSLRPRMTAVALRARKGGIVLDKRADERLGNQGKWDMHTGFVRAGETAEDTAERILREAGVGNVPFFLAAEGESGFSGTLSLFVADLPPGIYPTQRFPDPLEVDEDELAGLAADAADLLTPELVWAAGTGALFRR